MRSSTRSTTRRSPALTLSTSGRRSPTCSSVSWATASGRSSVESPDRFARDLIQQLLGHDLLKARGITLIAASSPQHFLEDTPTAVLIRQVLGGVAEFEKTTLVAKLKAARDRKRKATGKCGGRKSHLERRPAAVALAKSLARKNGRLSLRAIAVELEAQGYVNERGKVFNPKSIASMLGRIAS